MKFNSLIYTAGDAVSLSSNDISYTKLTENDIVMDHYLSPATSKPYTLPLKHQEGLEKS